MRRPNKNQFGKYKRWTKREIKLLKRSYALSKRKRKIDWIPELLKTRTFRQCSNKAGFLNLRRKRTGGYNDYLDVQKIFTEKELSYFVGILDGEGFIESRPENSCFRINITNTSKELMKWLAKKFQNGRIVKRKLVMNKWKTGYRKQQYEFEIAGIKPVYSFLRAILPYSIIKKERIKKVLKELQKKLK